MLVDSKIVIKVERILSKICYEVLTGESYININESVRWIKETNPVAHCYY